MPPTGPRALSQQKAIAERRALLKSRHIAPLHDFARSLAREGRGVVPDFDPLDGGVDAKILFLMEKPGPMTDETALSGRIGSGFISRDNNAPSAEATWRFSVEAGIDRKSSVIWNVIPWWNGTRKISRDEHIAGLDRLSKLMDLLPNLKVVVGVGNKAKRAKGLIEKRGLPFITSAHPSPINRAARPVLWAAIPGQWSQALRFV